MIKDDQQEQLYRDYTATMAGLTVQTLVSYGGNKWKAPSYVEMAHPTDVKVDTRSAEEIKDHVHSLFSSGKEKADESI